MTNIREQNHIAVLEARGEDRRSVVRPGADRRRLGLPGMAEAQYLAVFGEASEQELIAESLRRSGMSVR